MDGFAVSFSKTRRRSSMLEIVKFKAKEGIAEAQFREAMISLDGTMKHQDGFLGRELLKNGEEGWIDIVRWENSAAARKAQEEVMQNQECLAVFALIDDDSIELDHYEPVHDFQPAHVEKRR